MEDSPVPQREPSFRWEGYNLIAFIAFSVATVFFLPGGIFLLLRLFQPDLRIETLSGVQQILIQALMDIVLVGFIVFLVAAVHRMPIFRTLYLVPNESLRIGRLILGGALLAITVLHLLVLPNTFRVAFGEAVDHDTSNRGFRCVRHHNGAAA